MSEVVVESQVVPIGSTTVEITTLETLASEPQAEVAPEVAAPVAAPVVVPEVVASEVVVPEVVAPVAAPEETEAEELNQTLQSLFVVVSQKIRLSVSQGQLTTDSFTSILLKVVETVEELSSTQVQNISGTEKRAIAVNLTMMVIEDLHNHGQINDDVFNMLKVSVGFMAPLIFTAAKETWKKLQQVQDDISENGCKGCFGRNFFKARHHK